MAARARASGVPCPPLTTHPRRGAQPVSTPSAGRWAPRLRGTSSYPSRRGWRTVCSLRCLPAASRSLTAVRAHARASTLPQLHSANTVAWGWLTWDRGGLNVIRHGSQPAWHNRASLLAVVGGGIPHRRPQGGKSYHLIVKKPPLVRTLAPPGYRCVLRTPRDLRCSTATSYALRCGASSTLCRKTRREKSISTTPWRPQRELAGC